MTTLFRGRVRCIHFIGIGGIGMSGIAEVLLALGYAVHGSDLKASESTARLEKQGAVISLGHRSDNVRDADVVVMSSAVRPDNPEVVAAHARGIPLIPRAEMLAELMRLKHGVAVAGSHGKTTTTSLVATILREAGLDPTVIIGGKVNQMGSNATMGQGELLVAEADESDGSFLKLTPTLAIVTNLDLEHVDHYKGGLDEIKAAFASFLNRIPFYGLAVVCIDDPHVQALLPQLSRRFLTYGMSRQADLSATDVVHEGLSSSFTVIKRGVPVKRMTVNLAGAHNVQNALAAIAVADELGVSMDACAKALLGFMGVQRRFTQRGEVGGITVIDDYGHHPAEIRATLKAARLAYPQRRICVLFQPHRYSRTQALLDEFGRAFNDADVVRVLPVYAAGEAPIAGATHDDVVASLKRQGHRDADVAATIDAGVQALSQLTRTGDVVFTLGAGDVTHAGPQLIARLQAGATA